MTDSINTNKPVEGIPVEKDYWKKLAKKRQIYNNKHKTAPSTLTRRDGGASNI